MKIITCLKCLKDLPSDEFQWSPSSPTNKHYLCRDCEAISVHQLGISTQEVLQNIVSKGKLSRATLYANPDIIEAYKYQILIKRKINEK